MDGAKHKTPTAKVSKPVRHIEDIGIDFLQPQEYYWDAVKNRSRNPDSLKALLLSKSKPSVLNVAKPLKNETVETADNSRKTCDVKCEENVQLKLPDKADHHRKKRVKKRDRMLRKTAKILQDLPDGLSYSAKADNLIDCIKKDEEDCCGAGPGQSSIAGLSLQSDSCPVVKKKKIKSIISGDMYSSESVGSDSSSQENDKITKTLSSSPSTKKKRQERFNRLKESEMVPRKLSHKDKQIKVADDHHHLDLSDPESKFKKYWICADAVNDPKLRMVVFVCLFRMTQKFVESWCRPQDRKVNLEEECKNVLDTPSLISSSSADSCDVLEGFLPAVSSGGKPIQLNNFAELDTMKQICTVSENAIIHEAASDSMEIFDHILEPCQNISDSDTQFRVLAKIPRTKIKRKRHRQNQSQKTVRLNNSDEFTDQICTVPENTIIHEEASDSMDIVDPILQPRLDTSDSDMPLHVSKMKRKRHGQCRSQKPSTVFTAPDTVDEIIASVSSLSWNQRYKGSDSEEETLFSPKKFQRISAPETVPPRKPSTEKTNSPISAAEISSPLGVTSVVSYSDHSVSADSQPCKTASMMHQQHDSLVKITVEPEVSASPLLNQRIPTFIRLPCSKDDLKRIGIYATVCICLERIKLPFVGNGLYPNVFCHGVVESSGNQSSEAISNRTVANRRKRRAKFVPDTSDDSESGFLATNAGKKLKHKRHKKLKLAPLNLWLSKSPQEAGHSNVSLPTDAGHLDDSQSDEGTCLVLKRKHSQRSGRRESSFKSRALVPTSSSDSDCKSTSHAIIPKPAALGVDQICAGSEKVSKRPEGITGDESVNFTKEKSKSEKNKSKSSNTDVIAKGVSRKKSGTEKQRSRGRVSTKAVSKHKASSNSNSSLTKECGSVKRSHRDRSPGRDDKSSDRHNRFPSASARREDARAEDKLRKTSKSKKHSSRRRNEAGRSRENEKLAHSKGTKGKSTSENTASGRGKSIQGDNPDAAIGAQKEDSDSLNWDLQKEYESLCNIPIDAIGDPKTAEEEPVEDDICESFFLLDYSVSAFGSEEDENLEVDTLKALPEIAKVVVKLEKNTTEAGKRNPQLETVDANTEEDPQGANTEEGARDANLEEEPLGANLEQEPRDSHTEQEPRDSHTEQEPRDSHTEQEPRDSHTEQEPRDSHTEQEPRDSHTEQEPWDVNAEQEPMDTSPVSEPRGAILEEEHPGTNPEEEPQNSNPGKEHRDVNPEQEPGDENPLSMKECVTPKSQTISASYAMSDEDSDVYDPLDSFESDHRMDSPEDVPETKSPASLLSSAFTAPSPTSTAPSPTLDIPNDTAPSPGPAAMGLGSPASIVKGATWKGSDSQTGVKFGLPDFIVERTTSIEANKSQPGEEDVSDEAVDALSLHAPSLSQDSIFGGEKLEENLPSKESVCIPAVHGSGHLQNNRRQPTAIVKPMCFQQSAVMFDRNDEMFSDQDGDPGSEKVFMHEFTGRSISELLEELAIEIKQCNITRAVILFKFVETKMIGGLKCNMLDSLLTKTESGAILSPRYLAEIVDIVNRVVPLVYDDLKRQVQLLRKCLKTILVCKRTRSLKVLSQRLLDANAIPGLTKLYNDILLDAISADASEVLHLYKEGKSVGIRLDFVIVRALFVMFQTSQLHDLAKDVYYLGCCIGVYLNIMISEWPVCLKLRSYYTESEISIIFTNFISKIAIEFEETFFDDRQDLTDNEKYTIYICIENFQEDDCRNIRFLKDAEPSLEAVHKRIRKVLHINDVTKFTIAENFRIMKIDAAAVSHLLSKQKPKRLPLHLTVKKPRWANSSFFQTLTNEYQSNPL